MRGCFGPMGGRALRSSPSRVASAPNSSRRFTLSRSRFEAAECNAVRIDPFSVDAKVPNYQRPGAECRCYRGSRQATPLRCCHLNRKHAHDCRTVQGFPLSGSPPFMLHFTTSAAVLARLSLCRKKASGLKSQRRAQWQNAAQNSFRFNRHLGFRALRLCASWVSRFVDLEICDGQTL